MTEHVPEPWPFVLLALAAWRVWKLVGDDVILDTPRDWLVKRIGPKFDELITCPYCAGTYIVLAWWAFWYSWPEETLIVATPVAIMAVVGLLGTVWSAISD